MPCKKYHNNHRISERIKQFNNKRRRRQIKTKKKNVFEEEFASSRLQILTTLQRHKYRLHFHPRTIPLHKITKGGQFKALWYPKWQMSKVLLAGQESLLLCQVSYRTKFCEKKKLPSVNSGQALATTSNITENNLFYLHCKPNKEKTWPIIT